MAALHDALTELAPTEWSQVPQDGLEKWVQNLCEAGELICNSVPPPPNGNPFDASKPFSNDANTARSAKDMHASESRPYAPAEEHQELQSQWGKPIKFSSKDNPLNIAVYKTAGHDRHGAWFARSSVHEGIGFSKFRAAMLREFPETLKTQGGPGAGSIRGIGGDQRLERVELEHNAGDVEVYQLSAQFPGPTTPREFITLLITSSSALSEKSTASGIHHIPRHLMVISKPVKHDEAPDRSGYIRGQYESVEMIREIPLVKAIASKSTPDLLHSAEQGAPSEKEKLQRANSDGKAFDAHGDATDPEVNPVEWVMVTRSDPGGGIPRFMVERGTPSTMLGDVSKFLDWAAGIDENEEVADAKEVATGDKQIHASVGHPDGEQPAATEANVGSTQPTAAQPAGVFSSIAHAIEAGLDAYAPAMVSSFVHDKLDSRELPDDDTTDSSDLSDTASFTSATERRRGSIVPEAHSMSSESLSIHSAQLVAALGDDHNGDKKKLNQHEKELLKIAKEREKLEKKLIKKREEEEERLHKAQHEEETETSKAQERHDKEMKKQEEKYKKEIEKLENKKAKEARKAEEKRKKQLDRDTLHKVTRERDEFRSQVDLLKRENTLLRERIELLQPSTSPNASHEVLPEDK